MSMNMRDLNLWRSGGRDFCVCLG